MFFKSFKHKPRLTQRLTPVSLLKHLSQHPAPLPPPGSDRVLKQAVERGKHC